MSQPQHRFRFARAGGTDQVVLSTRADLERLEQLDLKLWAALAMPTRGVRVDAKTLRLLDTDGDGRILAPDLKAALRWCVEVLADAESLLRGGDRLPLTALREGSVRNGARRILESLGKAGADQIALQDVVDTERIFVATRFNGDGVVPAEAAEDEATRKVLEEIIGIRGPVQDRSGKPGVDRAGVEAFFAEVRGFHSWNVKPRREPALRPFGDATDEARVAVEAVQAKVDEYFARCALCAYSPEAARALEETERQACATSGDWARLPLATPAPGQPLPLQAGVNPAWAGPLGTLARATAKPGTPPRPTLTEQEWRTLLSELAPARAWAAARPLTAVEKLGAARIEELATGGFERALLDLLERDAALAAEYAQITDVEKLLLFHRDLGSVLRSFVNFADFYRGQGALFQAGRLYLDGRCCELCIEAHDPPKHAMLAVMASTYLAYCDCTRPGGERISIAAAFTDGDSDNLFVGRNGIFVDYQGRVWDATITKVVSHPISIRQAFWAPYKKLARLVEEQLTRRAAAAEEESTAQMAGATAAATTVDKAKRPEPKKIDVGTVAAIGVAIGGIGAMITGVLTAFLGLGLWMPVGLGAALLLVSGPSMLLAYLKLRQRNLGPLLDASGWAINGRARLNIPFGASLTHLAALPPGAERSLKDPYAEKHAPFRSYVALAAVVALLTLWYLGKLDAALPRFAKSVEVLGENAPAYKKPVPALPVIPVAPSPTK